MRFFVFFFSSLLFFQLMPRASLAAQPEVPAPQKMDRQVGNIRSQNISPNIEKKTPQKIKNPAPTTFRPTEKIGADTVIALPVDI